MKLITFYAERNENLYESFEGFNDETKKKKTFSFNSGKKSIELTDEDFELLSTSERFNDLIELEIIQVKEVKEVEKQTKSAEPPETVPVSKTAVKK